METITPEVETSLYVDILTGVIPFIFLVIITVIIVAMIYIVKIVKRYLENGKIAEQKLKMEETEIQEIKQRLERIEKILGEEG